MRSRTSGVQGSGFRVQGSGFRVQGSWFRVQGSGFRVQGSGFVVTPAKVRSRSSGVPPMKKLLILPTWTSV